MRGIDLPNTVSATSYVVKLRNGDNSTQVFFPVTTASGAVSGQIMLSELMV